MIQLQFLNYLLDSKDASLLVINNIGEEFFSDYISEYRYIKGHIDKYGVIPDKATFLTKFPSFDVVAVNETSSYLLDALYEDRNKRFLATSFNKVRELLNKGDTEEAMRVYLNDSDKAVQAKHLESVDLLTDTSRYSAYVDRCNDFSKYYITTGFKELDDIIGGWDKEEELVTIAARPGVGKTWIALKCATAALSQGLRVGIYSGEMSARKVGYRIDTLLSHISNTCLAKGNEAVQVDYKAFLEELPDRYKGCLKVLTPDMINGPAGVNALRAFIEKDNLDILFVDQHSLLEDDRHGRTAPEKASNISKDLKNLQVMKHIPIIAVSQQNRTSAEDGMDTSLIAQSDRIGQDSTIVIFIEQKDGVMTLHLTKSRDSENRNKISYRIDLDKGEFIYIPDVQDMKACEDLRQEFEEDVF